MSNIAQSILDFFTKKEKNKAPAAPEGLCPNCWGKQEYAGKVIEAMKDKQLDVKNHQANYAFIQNFVVQHVSGIQLQKDENGTACPVCNFKTEK